MGGQGSGRRGHGATKIEWTNKKEVKLRLDQISQKNPEFVRDCLDALIGKFIIEVEKRIPRDTGEYARSWYTQKEQFKATFTTALQPLARALEISGTIDHFVAPTQAKVLHWVEDGIDKFSKGHMVRGITPVPHIRPAKQEVMNEYKWIILAVAKKHFTYFQKTIQGSKAIPIDMYISVGRAGVIR